MESFMKIWKEFVLGSKSLSYHLSKGRTPFYEMERRRFMDTIVVQLDAAWLVLSDGERAGFKERVTW